MALEMHSALYALPEKFEKLHFYHQDVSTEKMPSSISANSIRTASTTTTNTNDYSVQFVSEKHHEQVLKHLKKFFFHDEPLNIAVKLLEGRDTCLALEQFCIKSLTSGASVIAITPNQEIIGVSLNAIDRKGQIIEDEPCNDKRFQKILNLLDTVEEKVDIFKRYTNVDSIINCKILSVDTNYRGKGIATALLDKTREIGREQGCKLMRVDCSSHYSAKAIAKLGFDKIFEMKYSEYKDNGEVVFIPEPPHTKVEVYVQNI